MFKTTGQVIVEFNSYCHFIETTCWVFDTIRKLLVEYNFYLKSPRPNSSISIERPKSILDPLCVRWLSGPPFNFPLRFPGPLSVFSEAHWWLSSENQPALILNFVNISLLVDTLGSQVSSPLHPWQACLSGLGSCLVSPSHGLFTASS